MPDAKRWEKLTWPFEPGELKRGFQFSILTFPFLCSNIAAFNKIFQGLISYHDFFYWSLQGSHCIIDPNISFEIMHFKIMDSFDFFFLAMLFSLLLKDLWYLLPPFHILVRQQRNFVKYYTSMKILTGQ